jgi:hypothetical protein
MFKLVMHNCKGVYTYVNKKYILYLKFRMQIICTLLVSIMPSKVIWPVGPFQILEKIKRDHLDIPNQVLALSPICKKKHIYDLIRLTTMGRIEATNLKVLKINVSWSAKLPNPSPPPPHPPPPPPNRK